MRLGKASDYTPRPRQPVRAPARHGMWPDVRVPDVLLTVTDEIGRHGMQEVSGSSLLSSTQVKHIIRIQNR